MKHDKLVKLTTFLVFDYDKEEAYINNMSHKGWKLIKGGLFHHTYTKCDQVYRYKLDFNNKIKSNSDEYYRYLSIFNEQGWEHINSTINGWHYFCKPYDPEAPEEDYMIYTDNSSLTEMLSRWIRMSRTLQIIFLLLSLLNFFTYVDEKHLISLLTCITCLVGISLLQLCIHNMKNKGLSTKTGPSLATFSAYALILLLFSTIIFTYYIMFHGIYIDKIEIDKKINQHTTDDSDTLTVKDSGEYYLDIKCKSERGIVKIQILQDNKVIYNCGGADFRVSNCTLNLKADIYQVKIIYLLEDFKQNYQVSQSELKKYHLDGDLNKMSNVDVFVGIKR